MGIGENSRRPQLLLDGQQRLTSLYAVMTGQPLIVRDHKREINIVFNVFSQKFEVATAFHRPQSGWVSLTKLFTTNPLTIFTELKLELNSPEAQQALENLTRLDAIRNYSYRVTMLEGLTYDEVTNIFVRVNSGGTRLSNADLALAQISSRWRGVSKELDTFQEHARRLGWELDDSILLRVLSALVTNQTTLSHLFRAGRSDELTSARLSQAWERAKPAMEQAILFIKQNCLVDRLNMLPTDYVLVPLTVFFEKNRDNISERKMRDLRRWLYLALIWARYSASSETNLDQDVAALGSDRPIERMIENIEAKVGVGRRVTERELQDQLSNSPFMVMAYVLARRNQAKDWFTGVAIGPGQDLEYHHIVPKAVLSARYKERDQSRIVNQIANLAFLSQRANARISASPPNVYLPEIEPARLQAQYVPTDPALWNPERFEEFALKRRESLAGAINDLLASLTDEAAPWVDDLTQQLATRIEAAEQSLRDLIEERIFASFGDHAWTRCVPNDVRDTVQQRIEQRAKRHPYEAEQLDALAARLAQCQFGDYSKIVRSNWPLFELVFRDKPTFDRQMNAVQDARNAIAHHRPLNPGEQHTAAGGLYWLEQCLQLAERSEDEEEIDITSPLESSAV